MIATTVFCESNKITIKMQITIPEAIFMLPVAGLNVSLSVVLALVRNFRFRHGTKNICENICLVIKTYSHSRLHIKQAFAFIIV